MLRVLHGPLNIANQPWVISRQERELGLKSDLVVSFPTWQKYEADRFLYKSNNDCWRSRIHQSYFGLTSALRYDVIHYYFGQSFVMWPLKIGWRGAFADLKLAKLLKRKVFMTLQGCDARLSECNSARNRISMCHVGRCSAAPDCRQTEDARRRALIANILPWCDRVFVLNPDLAHDVPGAVFMPYANVDVEAFSPTLPRLDGPIRIVHAPSDESIKGTAYLIAAVERLKDRWPIELTLVRGLPHAEAMKLYDQADIVVDQLLAGWYGGFAVEVMAMGKPVACYIRESDLVHLPDAMRAEMPILNVSPITLERDLEALFLRRREWPAWGESSRRFVLRWHHPRRIATALIRAYREPGSPFHLDNLAEEPILCAA